MFELHKMLEDLKQYEWVNLTHELHKDIPIYHTFNPLSMNQISTIDSAGADSREYTVGTSHGTHIDAPNHFAKGTRDLLEIGQKERVLTFNPLSMNQISTIDSAGADSREYTVGTSHGTHIDAPNHFAKGTRDLLEIGQKERVLPLYVIHLEDKVKETPGYAVTVDDIKEFEAEYGEIPAGSFVAFSSGWYKRFDDSDHFKNKDEHGVEHTPGWSIPALEFLSRTRNVTAIGHESLNTDSGVEAAEAGFLDAEYYWLAEDKYQIELMANLDVVPAVGSIIWIGVPHIKDAPGFPAEVYAIIPKEL